MFPASKPKLMLAISSRSPRARFMIETAARLAAQIHATWFVVHVREPMVLHYRMPATENPVPQEELDYARQLGGRVIIENGDVLGTLVAFARKMGIDYFVAGRPVRPRFSFSWRLPLMERLQRKLPEVVLVMA
jgi:K+-sensing histidine kinase KdpD